MSPDPLKRNASRLAPSAGGLRDRLLVIMAKAPIAGNVKTRLASAYPMASVIELYRSMLQDTIALGQSFGDTSVVLLCPEGDRAVLAEWAFEGVEIVEQRQPGLAGGLTSAFALCQNGRRTIAIDSDSPHVAPAWVSDAFQMLEAHDLVVGPTDDGGYYLVGGRAPNPTLFEAEELGSRGALEALLARARALGLSVAATHASYDVDRPQDLERLAAELLGDPSRAPRTAALLRASGVFVSANCHRT